MTWYVALLILSVGLLLGYLIGFFDGAKIALKLHRSMDEKLRLRMNCGGAPRG